MLSRRVRNAIYQLNTAKLIVNAMHAMQMMMSIKPGWAQIVKPVITLTPGAHGCLTTTKIPISGSMVPTKSSVVSIAIEEVQTGRSRHLVSVYPAIVARMSMAGCSEGVVMIATKHRVLPM
jgi:hypothetical protein